MRSADPSQRGQAIWSLQVAIWSLEGAIWGLDLAVRRRRTPVRSPRPSRRNQSGLSRGLPRAPGHSPRRVAMSFVAENSSLQQHDVGELVHDWFPPHGTMRLLVSWMALAVGPSRIRFPPPTRRSSRRQVSFFSCGGGGGRVGLQGVQFSAAIWRSRSRSSFWCALVRYLLSACSGCLPYEY